MNARCGLVVITLFGAIGCGLDLPDRLVIPPTRLTLAGTETPVDADDNGQYEQILIPAMLDISAPGTYRVWSSVHAGSEEQKSLTEQSFAPGHHALPLRLDGPMLAATGANGPYRVTVRVEGPAVWVRRSIQPPSIRMRVFWEYYEYREPEVRTLLTWIHTTAPYKIEQFASPQEQVQVLRIGPERPVDENQDGLIDFLEIPVQVHAVTPGGYTISQHVAFANGSWSSSSQLSLTGGRQVVMQRLSGSAIRRQQADGPYTLRYTLFAAREWSPQQLKRPGLVAETDYRTRAYRWTQFEDPPRTSQGQESLIRSR